MEKEKLISLICEKDQRLNVLTGRRNNYIFGFDENSVGKMLNILSSTKEELHPTDLCKILGVTTPRITIILNSMEEKGLIERKMASEDRRKITVVLTAKGKRAIKARNQKNYEFFEKVYEKLGPEDAEALYRSMQAYEEVYLEMKPDSDTEE